MSVFARFHLPVGEFALADALGHAAGARVELVRVTITREVLTPYFWATAEDLSAFHDALLADGSVSAVTLVGRFADVRLYRVAWADAVEARYADLRASVLGTVGTAEGWVFRVQFPDRDALAAFRDRFADAGVSFTVRSLTDLDSPPSGLQYGLTPKQSEAILAAWELGYYRKPREATLADVAADLDISQQALSDRLQRGHETLVRNTVVAPSPLQPDGSR
ncbi:helix-turn-helix domain-containing protein [Haloglomus litoreum]|uniref:helix-turn-helix domain-containing protein n=1 Tax=Haloglomus litoreum TaxID=3034026 RepID=UPI0023E84000|nr:helix-turn-helix domain-containing protein [Haloglomus sp. DT116]